MYAKNCTIYENSVYLYILFSMKENRNIEKKKLEKKNL